MDDAITLETAPRRARLWRGAAFLPARATRPAPPVTEPRFGEPREDEGMPPSLPVVHEVLHVHKRLVPRGRVRVSTRTEATERLLGDALRTETVTARHVRVDRVLTPGEPVPTVRTEGDVTIVPVFEEILVVERRLVLREEVHIVRTAQTSDVEIPITVLRQRAVIERVGMDGLPTAVDPTTTEKALMNHTITALFDEEIKARIAADDLVEAGIPRADVRVVPGATGMAGRAVGPYDHHKDEGGFWATLKGIFMPDEDRYTYSEGLSRGGTMLSVDAPERDRERVSDLLERSGAIDLDQREASWRQDGWAGYAGTPAAGATPGSAASSAGTGQPLATATEDATFAAGSFLGTVGQKIEQAVGGRGAADHAGYIPVVEERLDVGKRVVDHGRVRLRSYVVETPVEERVSLRDEVVHVDRRKVDRPLSAGDIDPFVERTVEVDEKGEEVVVQKEARVVEEIGLRKDSVDRTETVKDKLRRTEVEIDDERRGAASRPLTDRT